MASVFTYDPDPPRVSSPWSTPGSSTPRRKRSSTVLGGEDHQSDCVDPNNPNFLVECGITKLDPEPQEGPTEYKLHILLRPRRSFLSLSTGNFIPGSSHSRPSPAVSGISQDPAESGAPLTQSWSSQSRQHRLHQLTTQLLWRLQQSSPFHSSSAANLVLPVLPEPTPTLKVPQVLSPLPPGLEESQGALYEIGVSDDGSFVGLAEDELNESIINLEAMAASLGCKVEVLRRVVVGHGEWATSEASDDVHSGKLWVAEVLVSPELKRHSIDSTAHPETNGSSASVSLSGVKSHLKPTEQLHVAIAGPTGAGKSSLLGILSTSALDNGRGKSRLSLLKHRHEIASGVTSSIAQELIGYSEHTNSDTTTGRPDILNYADGNIASWNDIHASANGGRVVFLSDLPGSLRYSKSTLRGLVSWRPHYVLLCVPASNAESSEPTDPSPVDISVAYLELCVKLELPIVVVLTKLDAALLSNLRETLNRILTTIKSSSKEPIMIRASAETAEQNLDLRQISESDRQGTSSAIMSVDRQGRDAIPIIMTSAVTGTGIGKLHALLRGLPFPEAISAGSLVSNGDIKRHPASIKSFDINEVFEMPLFKVYSLSNENKRKDDRGIILCGCMRDGNISVGDRLVVGPIPPDSRSESDLPSLAAPQPKTTSDKNFADINREETMNQSQIAPHSYWQEVRVVSVRNLRVPGKALSQHQIGTVGVDPVEPSACLGRIRKGMLLADFSPPSTTSSLSLKSPMPHLPPSPSYHTGFIASFPAAEFASASTSPLAIGGNAMAYIGSIRAAVKLVSAEPPGNGHVMPSSMAEPDIFTLDDAPSSMENQQDSATHAGRPPPESPDVKITVSFVSSIEWVAVGSRVLVMPATPTGMPSSSTSRTPSGSYGLQGFVGRVCDVLSA